MVYLTFFTANYSTRYVAVAAVHWAGLACHLFRNGRSGETHLHGAQASRGSRSDAGSLSADNQIAAGGRDAVVKQFFPFTAFKCWKREYSNFSILIQPQQATGKMCVLV